MTLNDMRPCPSCSRVWVSIDVVDCCTRCRAQRPQTTTNVKASPEATRVQFTTDSHTYVGLPYGEVVKRVVIARRRGDQTVWLDGHRIVLDDVRAIHPPAEHKQRAA